MSTVQQAKEGGGSGRSGSFDNDKAMLPSICHGCGEEVYVINDCPNIKDAVNADKKKRRTKKDCYDYAI